MMSDVSKRLASSWSFALHVFLDEICRFCKLANVAR